VDVILKAFSACAASHGCMVNNLTFGDKEFECYETIAGGAGAAGPACWEGCSGIHTLHQYLSK
jgi:5-oxoprolinase (ATP-hydrolysing)